MGAGRHVQDGRETDQFLAGRTHLRDLNALVAQLFHEHLVHLIGRLAPQVTGVSQLDLTSIDPQVHRLGRDSSDHDAVEPGELELCRPEAARLAVAYPTGQRGLGNHGRAALTGDGCPGDAGQHERERVLRAIGVCAGRCVLEEVVETQGTATHVGAVQVFRRLFDAERSRCEVDVQDLPCVTVKHSHLLSNDSSCRNTSRHQSTAYPVTAPATARVAALTAFAPPGNTLTSAQPTVYRWIVGTFQNAFPSVPKRSKDRSEHPNRSRERPAM